MTQQLESDLNWESPEKILGLFANGKSLEETKSLVVSAHDLGSLQIRMQNHLRKVCAEKDLFFEETLLLALDQYGNYLPLLEALHNVADSYRRGWYTGGARFPTQRDYVRWIMGENSEREIDAKLNEKYAALQETRK